LQLRTRQARLLLLLRAGQAALLLQLLLLQRQSLRFWLLFSWQATTAWSGHL
jgi:hypothetical protein